MTNTKKIWYNENMSFDFQLKLAKHINYFEQEHNQSFILKKGHGLVMISAPHSVEQLREGKIKCAETQTGILGLMLHDDLECPLIYKTRNCNDDANYDKISEYKEALSDYINENNIKFLIDLHQLAPEREVSINFGTSSFRNLDGLECFDILSNEFAKQNLGIIRVDEPYGASFPYTVSSYIRNKCKIQSVQIELNSKLLYGENSEETFEYVYFALRESIIKINKLLENCTNEKTGVD